MSLNQYSAEEIIRLLELEPLPHEGGFFRRTHLSPHLVKSPGLGDRPALSAIYYLITPTSFSSLHRLPSDEVFHFYAGDAVEMVQIDPAGKLTKNRLGQNLADGERIQALVPAHAWQGSKLSAGGRWALLGTNVGPAFDFEDLVIARAEDLSPSLSPADRAHLETYLAR